MPAIASRATRGVVAPAPAVGGPRPVSCAAARPAAPRAIAPRSIHSPSSFSSSISSLSTMRLAPSAPARRSSVSSAAAAAPASPSTSVPIGSDGLILPYGGGELVDLLVRDASEAASLVAGATKRIEASDRNACDVELLGVGGFSPLRGFLGEKAYRSVVENARLPEDDAWGPNLPLGLPIVLDVREESGVAVGDRVLLTYKGQDLAVVDVEEVYRPDKAVEALGCYGTSSLEHPAVRMVACERGPLYVSGPVRVLSVPSRGFHCATPAEVRATLPRNAPVLAFQCRNPIHRAHYELLTRAGQTVAAEGDAAPEGRGADAVVLVHPTIGPTQEDDIPGDVRFRTYKALAAETNNPQLRWAYLPYAMHMAGPREALQHMIIRRNYGCTRFIIGRDMAGCKSSITSEDFYGAYDAQEFAQKYEHAPLSIALVPSLNIVYTETDGFVTADVAAAKGLKKLSLSGTKFRKMLREGSDIPEWFSFPSVVKVLRQAQEQ